MQSFITLMNEKQLSIVEQRQVYDSIKKDYEDLISAYEDAKELQSGSLPNEIDLDMWVVWFCEPVCLCLFDGLMGLYSSKGLE